MRIDLTAASRFELPLIERRTPVGTWMNDYLGLGVPQHYRLLGYLASRLWCSTICDLGTSTGLSAAAFGEGSLRRNNHVVTYDVRDDEFCIDLSGLPVVRRVANVLDCLDELQAAHLILIDVDHSAHTERVILESLAESHYDGVVVMDDIDSGPGLRELFRGWNRHVKYDLSAWAHWSGTGLIDFGGRVRITKPDGQLLRELR
jgi:predicted O-methyltransferase YrrM